MLSLVATIKMKKLMFLLIILIIVTSVYAHQPRLPAGNITKIKNPEISQAFYAELTGQPHTYIINSDKPFNLYAGILVPALKNSDKDYFMEITEETKDFYVQLKPSDSDWLLFHEEFANDNYYWGPEFGANQPLEGPKGIPVKAGTYKVKIYSPDNQGKYVFVVGYLEEFSLKEMLSTLIRMPKIKSYFGKSPFTAYFNRVGLFLLIPLIIILAIIIFLLKWKKKKASRIRFKKRN